MIYTGYNIVKKLGEGAHGTVLLVEKDNTHYALKFFNDVFSFQKELAFFSFVSDRFPFFPRFVEACSHGLYIVMEYLDGFVTLSSMIDEMFQHSEEGSPTFFKAAAELRDVVLPVLDRMLEHGLTHGDLSLDNIMIHPSTLQVKMVDFTMSKLSMPQFRMLDYKRFLDSIALKIEVYYSEAEYKDFTRCIRQRISE